MRPAVFLDRDGTINEEKIYLSDPAEFSLLPGVGPAVRRLNEAGWAVVVVTNQSGLARGYFTPETLQAIHRRLEQDLAVEHAYVDAIYFCPHHPDDGCACRKPATTLFLQAVRDLNLDLNRTVFVGDKLSDLQPGYQLNRPTVLVLTGHGYSQSQTRANWNFEPDAILPDLSAAIDWLLHKEESH